MATCWPWILRQIPVVRPAIRMCFLKLLVCVENQSPSFVKMTIEAEKMTWYSNDKIIACTENNMAPVRRKSREVRDGNGALGECTEQFRNGHLYYCGRPDEDWDDDDKAATEYQKYKARTLSGVERDYLDAIQLLEQKTGQKGIISRGWHLLSLHS